MTHEEILKKIKEVEENGYKFHHHSLKKGYISKGFGRVSEYDGRFGNGFKVEIENRKSYYKYRSRSNNYHLVFYFIQ